MNKRVLIAGLYHETNTFLEGSTGMEDFEILRGEELVLRAGDTSPLAGAIESAVESRWDILPAIDMRALPGPIVDDSVPELFLDAIQSATSQQKLDGILLVLHGAMVSRSWQDVEGEILEQIRALYPQEAVPICGVLDLHANFTEKMGRNSDGLLGYRENPHTDAKQAAKNAASLLDRIMTTGERPRTMWLHSGLMWPPTGTGTANEPMQSLESLAREIEQYPGVFGINVWAGFAFADVPDAGLSFSAVVDGDPERMRMHLERLVQYARDRKESGMVLDLPVPEVMEKLVHHRAGPVLLVEPSDNIGAGASGRGTSILRALLEHDVQNAAVVINAPEMVKRIEAAHPNNHVQIHLRGPFDPLPLDIEVDLISTSSGRFRLEDPHSHLASMYGSEINMGPCAVVRCRGVQILLTSRPTPPFDLGQLRSQGIVPEELFAIGVKAAVAHRRAYDRVARVSYNVDTPGPCTSNLKNLPYQRVRRPVFPLDK